MSQNSAQRRQMAAAEAYIQFRADAFLEDGTVADPSTREFQRNYVQ